MKTPLIKSAILSCVAVMATAVSVQAKPLKVFILCGQSNMEGHAQTMTFPAVAKDPKTSDLYKAMVGADGKPVVCDDVWIAYSYGDFSGNPVGKKSGKLTAGFGSQHHIGTGKIGPEFTFGIYMHKFLNEPILLIKDAWGGKSLKVDFRPPSGGEIEDEKSKDKAGVYYKLLIEHVKEVLADPKKVYPNYDPKEGYELSGFVWFQGFNDLVGSYPAVDPAKGKKGTKDYSEYSRLLACLIRDVRKDLSAPKLPFVIGVLGVGGETSGDGTEAFRKSMAAPGETAEFKGNVANVFTHEFWPVELDAVLAKSNPIKSEFATKEKELKGKDLKGDERAKAEAALAEEKKAKLEKALTQDERFLLENGISNQGYHYYGSAKFFGQAGKAFAESLVKLKKDAPGNP
ncbi:MAG: hypothetical protein CFE26_13340 [Verrucomicrobiales bacterium VVV1]|nr:MAG: hypothetical protein CFE26_13340 [Verrucomicrobiales bacterium VVV1]